MRANAHLSTALLVAAASLAASSWALADSGATTPASQATTPTTTSSTTTPAAAAAANSTPGASTKTTSTSTSTTTTTTTTASPASTRRPPADCPSVCVCSQREVNCEGRNLTQLPSFERSSNFVEFRFANNRLQSLELRQFPLATIEKLDLSNNPFQVVAAPSRRTNELPRLRTLHFGRNTARALSALANWKMPQLESLDLSGYNFEHEELSSSHLGFRPNLRRLDLSGARANGLHEFAFVNLPALEVLNLSSVEAPLSLALGVPDQLLAKSGALSTLDVSRNRLLEVPVFVRKARSLKSLILNGNPLTSLRPSDFAGLANLERLELRSSEQLLRVEPQTFGELRNLSELVISQNANFYDFSPAAFEESAASNRTGRSELLLLDLSANKLSSLARLGADSPPVQQLSLAGNPWHCDCALDWLVRMPGLYRQQPVHCKTPRKFQGLELSQFFQMHDCQPAGNELRAQSYLSGLLVILLVLSILLFVVIFVQRSELWRRLRWRDQYGTIYYTKASFPSEQAA